jgi:hypothetical protein
LAVSKEITLFKYLALFSLVFAVVAASSGALIGFENAPEGTDLAGAITEGGYVYRTLSGTVYLWAERCPKPSLCGDI